MRAPNKTADEKAAEAADKEDRQNKEEAKKIKARTALDAFEKRTPDSSAVKTGSSQVKVARPVAGNKTVSASGANGSALKAIAPLKKVSYLNDIDAIDFADWSS